MLLDGVSGEVEDVGLVMDSLVLVDVVVTEVSELIDDSETVLLLDGSVLLLDPEDPDGIELEEIVALLDIVEDDDGMLRLEVLPGEAAGTLSVVG